MTATPASSDLHPDHLFLNELARRVQCHVPEWPWGRYGDRPPPLGLSYDADRALWFVKFAVSLKNGRAKWGYANGPTVLAALQAARDIQAGGGPR